MHRTLIFGSIILAILTISSGLIHGRLSHRWGETGDILAAGKLLEELPTTAIGNWKCEQSKEIDVEALKMLESVGNFSRTYTNTSVQPRTSIELFSIIGPRGPTIAHTPDVCYSSRDYRFSGERTRHEINTPDGKTHTFWSRTLKSNDEFNPHTLDVWHAWSIGDTWSAPDNRRLAFLTSPSLYKLQLAIQVPQDEDKDTVQENGTKELTEFLEGFLPLLSQYMN